jgi:glycine cleavage system transcriptional repressor
MSSVAVTVVGHDRPGIVAEVAAAVADLGGNLEDSSMTLLRGHFAMTLVADVADAGVLRERLAHLQDEQLSVLVVPVPGLTCVELGPRQVFTLHGADRPGIVQQSAALLAEFGGNITDISTRLGPSLYVLAAEVEFPAATDVDLVADRVAVLAQELDVVANLRPAEEDVL